MNFKNKKMLIISTLTSASLIMPTFALISCTPTKVDHTQEIKKEITQFSESKNLIASQIPTDKILEILKKYYQNAVIENSLTTSTNDAEGNLTITFEILQQQNKEQKNITIAVVSLAQSQELDQQLSKVKLSFSNNLDFSQLPSTFNLETNSVLISDPDFKLVDLNYQADDDLGVLKFTYKLNKNNFNSETKTQIINGFKSLFEENLKNLEVAFQDNENKSQDQVFASTIKGQEHGILLKNKDDNYNYQLEIVNFDDLNGTLEIKVTINKDNKKSKPKIFNLSGFKTFKSPQKAVEEFLEKLKIKQSSFSKTIDQVNKYDFDYDYPQGYEFDHDLSLEINDQKALLTFSLQLISNKNVKSGLFTKEFTFKKSINDAQNIQKQIQNSLDNKKWLKANFGFEQFKNLIETTENIEFTHREDLRKLRIYSPNYGYIIETPDFGDEQLKQMRWDNIKAKVVDGKIVLTFTLSIKGKNILDNQVISVEISK
ncbi:lipoprotein 17-related variable surface protein [Mycoplasmopsis ciconiae]|uniref:Lipoprotein 17-related variable surface protein n=1 Tax=Mycoplasmopsis ciconiae TaxID=561067 RepID=A0ABU7MM33_9BACT|nr:lipoprotein 17-related variable surface protein [Mycoplasmopsis ciconiae]